MKLAIFTLITAFSLILPLSGAMADKEKSGAEKAIEYRQSIMNIYAWNLKPMGKVVKGEVPFEAGSFQRHARDLAAASQLHLFSGFPDDSDEGEDTDAKSEIWLDWENFEQKYQNFQEKVDALNTAAQSGELERIRPAFGSTAKSCKDCHKAFRE
jgi:cytochrome c556